MTEEIPAPTVPEEMPSLQAIGTVARMVGLTARAIRYYEELGLLQPAVRVKGADRLFDADDIRRLNEIKRLREVIGFSLAEIAELLDTEATREQLRERFGDTTDAAVRTEILHDALTLAERRLAMFEGKLAQVAAIRDEELQRVARVRRLLADENDKLTTPEAHKE